MHENIWAKLGKLKSGKPAKQKLLGVAIDDSLKFDLYVSSLGEKAGKKLPLLARLSNFMSLNHLLNHSSAIGLWSECFMVE